MQRRQQKNAAGNWTHSKIRKKLQLVRRKNLQNAEITEAKRGAKNKSFGALKRIG